MRQYFLSIPHEIEEAARIDGASFFTTFWRVMLPLAGPALAAVAILQFQGTWNGYFWPYVILQQPGPVHRPGGAQLLPAGRRPCHELAAVDGDGRPGDHPGPRPVPVLPALLRRGDRGQWRQGLRRQPTPAIRHGPPEAGDRRSRRADRLLFQLDATGGREPGLGLGPCPHRPGRAGLAAPERWRCCRSSRCRPPASSGSRRGSSAASPAAFSDDIAWPYRHAPGSVRSWSASRSWPPGSSSARTSSSASAAASPRAGRIATLAAWGLIVLWCGALVAWPLLVDPSRSAIGRSRERLRLAGAAAAGAPAPLRRRSALAMAVVVAVSVVLTAAILTISVAFVALVACRSVYPAADRLGDSPSAGSARDPPDPGRALDDHHEPRRPVRRVPARRPDRAPGRGGLLRPRHALRVGLRGVPQRPAARRSSTPRRSSSTRRASSTPTRSCSTATASCPATASGCGSTGRSPAASTRTTTSSTTGGARSA